MPGRTTASVPILLSAMLALSPWPSLLAVESPSAVIDPVVPEAIGYYDSCADRTKRQIHRKVADASDTGRDGVLDRPVQAPPRFGVLRLYPSGWRMAKKIADLPQAQQQLIWSHVHTHQVRSGWIKPGEPPVQGPPAPPASPAGQSQAGTTPAQPVQGWVGPAPR